jgi:hypothetical protein
VSDKSLARQLEALKEELKKPLPTPQHEGTTMAAKKKVKKIVKKKTNGSGEDFVHLADLAKEADVSPQRIRQKLRAAEIERDGRWKWEKGSNALKKVRKALDLPA